MQKIRVVFWFAALLLVALVHGDETKAVVEVATETPTMAPKIQKNKKKCWQCKKKIPIIGYNGFVCRCEYVFCAPHLHDHECTYDYRLQEPSTALGGGDFAKIDKI